MKSLPRRCAFLIVLGAAACLTACASRPVTGQAEAEEERPSQSLEGGSLGGLHSYRLELQKTIRWESGGQAVEETEIIMQEAAHAPQEWLHIRRLVRNAETGIIPASSDEYRLGSLAFFSEQQNQQDVCRVYDLEGSPLVETGVIDPEELLKGAERRGPVERRQIVNDTVVDQFTASGLNLPLEGVENEQVNIWIAQKGGYIVRFTVDAQGLILKDGVNMPASLHWEFDLTAINPDVRIILSSDCQQQKDLLDSLPIPPSATDKQIMRNSITFSAPEASQVTAAFIRQGMQASGWKTILDHVDEMEEMYMLQYEQGVHQMDVLISQPARGGSFVTFSQRP